MAYVHNKDLKSHLEKIYQTDCPYAKDDFFTLIQEIAVDQAVKRGISDREIIDDFFQYSMIKMCKIIEQKAIDTEQNIYGFLTRFFSNKAIDFLVMQSRYNKHFILLDDDQWQAVLDEYELQRPNPERLDISFDDLGSNQDLS